MAEQRNDVTHASTSTILVVLAWLIVLVPLGFGLWQTILKAGLLLSGG